MKIQVYSIRRRRLGAPAAFPTNGAAIASAGYQYDAACRLWQKTYGNNDVVTHSYDAENYPPQTAEEKAMWEWWDAMDKAAPDFQWKMPIEFYGKVIDQFGQPIAGAKDELNWTTVIGPIPDSQRNMLTGSDGRFEVTGIQAGQESMDCSRKARVPNTDGNSPQGR
ncbi:MAG: carboxypeptidase-like regulatory domain-containing protein [Verrucomicrobiota bacterium]